MIRVSNVKFRPKAVPDDLQAYVAELTGFDNIVFFRIAKKSVDARKKETLSVLYSFDLALDGDEEEAVKTCPYRDICRLADEVSFPEPVWNPKNTLRPVIIGTGPAGMMAGLLLAQALYFVIACQILYFVPRKTRKLSVFSGSFLSNIQILYIRIAFYIINTLIFFQAQITL